MANNSQTGGDSILLVLPVPFRLDSRGRLLVERQASNGMNRWAENFGRVVVACPMRPGAASNLADTTCDYVLADDLASRDHLEFVPLPWAYGLGKFLESYRRTRKLLAPLIDTSKYLSFAIGGLLGDWPSVAALEAIRQRRKFSVWTDRVEHRVVKRSHTDQRGLRKAYSFVRNNFFISPAMKRLERSIISKCDLGLFHGLDCFDAYASLCRNPHLVHDIHLKPGNRITPERLAEKLDRVRSGAPLRIVYAGRVAGMKGPLDWVAAMADLRDRGLDFQATWIGDGPLLPEMRDEARRRNLDQVLTFPGHISDRERLLENMRDSDLFVFCHKTPESPRCLIEALMCGTPLLGYGSPYSQDLLQDLAGGLLVDRDDKAGLADRIAYFDDRRDALAEMIQACYQLGEKFSDQAVFKHRSDLIKEHLAY